MNNTVETKTIAELRDARVFYIPAYQRGYRWNKEQVEDLLNDLYTFAKKKDKMAGEFYCLQPIIVKQITSEAEIEHLKAENPNLNVSRKTKFYEVIDGQQRRTTLSLLMRYLIKKIISDKKEEERSKLYQLIFQTRKEMFNYISNIQHQESNYTNIDEKHAYQAYQWIDEWFKSMATQSLKKLDLLLRQGKDTKKSCGSVQVIWYEISQDKNEIREFLSTNNGKISLTDAELVKALFLQKRNFQQDEKNLKQIEKAMEWERIENTLHQDDFWYFINPDKSNPSNRIEYILRLSAGIDNAEGQIVKEKALFNHYYKIFEKLSGKELEKKINAQWSIVIECFRCIEDWYLDPIKYNYIGFLTHSGLTLPIIYRAFRLLNPEQASQSDFIDELKKLVKGQMDDIQIVGDFINKEYTDRNAIRKVLLLLNVHTLNSQLHQLNQKFDKVNFNSPTYKFPFDVYINQCWDVEHIDSATPRKEEQKNWVDERMHLYEKDEAFTQAYAKAQDNNDWNYCISYIQKANGEDDEYKNEIGNLTLLDSQTNRSYGNAPFPEKRERILKEIRNGKYVPHCTQMVFYKSFDKGQMSSLRWDKECKKAYGRYVGEQIKEYLYLDLD